MYNRHLSSVAREALRETRVLLIHGGRQVGKTTLAQQLVGPDFPATYVSLDDLTTLAQAQRDPVGFIAQFTGPVIIDEVQRAPEIFLPIKVAVDTDQRPGRFVLTGSANVLTLPKLADSLAGRMELLTLWPLAQSEIAGREGNCIDWLWLGQIPFQQDQALGRADLLNRILRGGYPAALSRATERSRQQWFDGYVTTLLERDVRDLSKVRDLREFPRLLQSLAGRSSALLNMQDIARSLALQHETLRRYLALLEALWLVVELPAWSANVNSRLVKTPKMSLNDTGLLAGLLNLDAARLERESVLLGQCLESFVVMELRKHLSWSQTRAQMYHCRDHKGAEVDIVLEAPSGELIGIEVKATASPGNNDLAGLRKLQEWTGKRFKRGILFHTGGTQTVFGKDLYLAPLQRLWQPTEQGLAQ